MPKTKKKLKDVNIMLFIYWSYFSWMLKLPGQRSAPDCKILIKNILRIFF